MKNETLRNKVISKLVKGGYNESDAISMVNKEFEYASRKYSGVSKIARVISCLA